MLRHHAAAGQCQHGQTHSQRNGDKERDDLAHA
jgi:hypothetical protein